MNMTSKHGALLFAATFSLLLLMSGCAPKPGKQTTQDSTIKINQKEVINVIPEYPEPDTIKGSLKAEATGKIGSANICVRYTSPAVRGRGIWGELVPFNKVWVTGAHNATSIETDQPIIIGGKNIPAGKYAFFTIPDKDEWTVIINKNWDQHQADKYSESEDLVRLTVKPQTVEKNQERLRYDIAPEGGAKGNLVLTWEKIRLSVPISQ